jgi:hypothetical protein
MTKSTRPIVLIHNVSNGEILEREMDDAEFAQYQADQEASSLEKQKAIADQEAKNALLERLGITAEEAALLLG